MVKPLMSEFCSTATERKAVSLLYYQHAMRLSTPYVERKISNPSSLEFSQLARFLFLRIVLSALFRAIPSSHKRPLAVKFQVFHDTKIVVYSTWAYAVSVVIYIGGSIHDRRNVLALISCRETRS